MCWTLSLEEGKPNGLSHLIKNGYVDILYRMLLRVAKVFVWDIDEILKTLHKMITLHQQTVDFEKHHT